MMYQSLRAWVAAASAAVLMAIPGAAAQAQPTDYFVDKDSAPGQAGTSWGRAFRHLQDALLVAGDGDVIHVAQGVYRPDLSDTHPEWLGDRTRAFSIRQSAKIYGGFAGVLAPDPSDRDPVAYPTILSGDLLGNDPGLLDASAVDELDPLRVDNAFVVFMVAKEREDLPTDVRLDGLHIRSGFHPRDQSAGITGEGGALVCLSSGKVTVELFGVHLEGNYAGAQGGAIFNDGASVKVQASYIRGNASRVGAGVSCVTRRSEEVSGFEATRTIFEGNCLVAGDSGEVVMGAAYASRGIEGASIAMVDNCLFLENSAVTSGGLGRGCVYLGSRSQARFECNTFRGNSADSSAGGATLYCDSGFIILNFLNNLCWGATSPANHMVYPSMGIVRVGYNNVEELVSNAPPTTMDARGNIDGDPDFLDVSGRIGGASACIDAGVNRFAERKVDFDGAQRILDDAFSSASGLGGPNDGQTPGTPGLRPIVDIGAFEFFRDCNGNGVLDTDDVASGDSEDCNQNGLPDECEDLEDCNGNGVFDVCEAFDDCDQDGVPDECGPDCDGDGTPDSCEEDCNGDGVPDDCQGLEDCNADGIPDDCQDLPDCDGDGVPDTCQALEDCNDDGVFDVCQMVDCNGNGVLDECDISSGESDDCDMDGAPDECGMVDCNGNGTLDSCDIASGLSEDCDLNGVPDECQPDCNGNGVPDPCDVLSGFSLDCNDNLVPDECEPDCNSTGIPDECDIANGVSTDCNANMIPDECEFPEGDQDSNGVLDDCEINCAEFLRGRLLTGRDTITLITNADNPEQEAGYVYVHATDSDASPVAFDHLIGQVLIVDGIESFDYSINAVDFRSAVGEREPTDLDDDGNLDLDGVEYEMAPNEILVPRFFGVDPGIDALIESYLVMLNLSGGREFRTTVDFMVYNDNEEAFSTEYSFKCWDKVRLDRISGVFTADFLSDFTNHDPTEVVGAPLIESGWFRMSGYVANSSLGQITDPAIYGVLIERGGLASAAELPFELGGRAGHLLSAHPQGDNSEWDGVNTVDLSVNNGRRSPGSLLLFPEFDNRDGVVSVLTVTNTSSEDVNVRFVYTGRWKQF